MQLAGKQDILQSMLMKKFVYFEHHLRCVSCIFTVTNTFKHSSFNNVAWIFTTTTHFLTKSSAIRASSCPPAPLLTQLPKYDDELASTVSSRKYVPFMQTPYPLFPPSSYIGIFPAFNQVSLRRTLVSFWFSSVVDCVCKQAHKIL